MQKKIVADPVIGVAISEIFIIRKEPALIVIIISDHRPLPILLLNKNKRNVKFYEEFSFNQLITLFFHHSSLPKIKQTN